MQRQILQMRIHDACWIMSRLAAAQEGGVEPRIDANEGNQQMRESVLLSRAWSTSKIMFGGIGDDARPIAIHYSHQFAFIRGSESLCVEICL